MDKPDANMMLGTLINSVFSNKSPELDAFSATYTVISDSVFIVNWPQVDDGVSVVYAQFTARPVAPKDIRY